MLKTDRLILNDFEIEDAQLVSELAGDIRVVNMTSAIPYPYKKSMALEWINSHKRQREEKNNHIFAIRKKDSLELIGCINISFENKHDRGYLGYWIGHPNWGKGFCTEALNEVIKYGFSFKGINKIWATHKTNNIASARVMEKSGMSHEGIMRSHHKEKEGEYLDMSIKSILRSEFDRF